VATLSFTYSFGKSIATPHKRDTGGASSEQDRAH